MTFHRMDIGKESKGGKKKRQQATALGYDPLKDDAPRILATGSGEIAEKILALARENNIPIQEDALLAAALSKLEVDQTIPPELYAVVAEVLAYVYRIQNKKLPKI